MENLSDSLVRVAPEAQAIQANPITAAASEAYRPESQAMYNAASSSSVDSTLSSLPDLHFDFGHGPSDVIPLPQIPHFGGGAGGGGVGDVNFAGGNSGQEEININLGDGPWSTPAGGQGPTTYNFDIGGDNNAPASTTGTTYNFNIDVPPSVTGGTSPDININIGDGQSPMQPIIGPPIEIAGGSGPLPSFDNPVPTAGTGGDITPATSQGIDLQSSGQPLTAGGSYPIAGYDSTVGSSTMDGNTADPLAQFDQMFQSMQAQLNQIESSLGIGQNSGVPFLDGSVSGNPIEQIASGLPVVPGLPSPDQVVSTLDPTNPSSPLDPLNPANPLSPQNPLSPENVLDPASPSSPLNPSNIGNDLNPFSSSNPVNEAISSIGNFFSNLF
jgi:hypothetical protein